MAQDLDFHIMSNVLSIENHSKVVRSIEYMEKEKLRASVIVVMFQR